MQVTLKRIAAVDFRSSEQTNLRKLQESEKLRLADKEAVLFINKGQNQLIFVYADLEMDLGEKNTTALRSERLRLNNGHWDPLMLANYAEKVKLRLVGIKRFEQLYKEMQEAKKQKRSKE